MFVPLPGPGRGKQVTGKLKNVMISYLRAEEDMCKEQKSKLESNDTVSKAVFDQIKWERDVALRTLEEHGIGFAERATCSKMETVDTDLISRQAAIEVIKQYDFDFPQYMERFVTELRNAMKKDLLNDVKSLPPVTHAKHTETHGVCSDCISRQAAIDAVEKAVFKGVAKSAIESLPPAEPERPRGAWIQNAPEGQGIDPPYICSICGYAEATRTPFCEQCGADMRGEK